MNRDRLQYIWTQLSRKVTAPWGSRPDDPFLLAAGRRDGLDARIRQQCDISKQRADRQLEEFMLRHLNWRDLSER